MKKILGLSLALLLIISIFTACGSGDDINRSAPTDAQADTNTPDVEPTTAQISSEVPLDTFMVGTAEMNGDFIGGFGNNTYDLSVRVLTGGYIETFTITPEGDFDLNETVVENFETTSNDDGSKTYIFKIHDDLFWNNGEQITAKDFIATILWTSSPEWAEAGASSSGYDALVGYSAYNSGETDVFAGAKLISDLEFSMTVSADNFPYFWEFVNVLVGPTHFETYLPNCEISSTEEGVSLVFSEGDLLTNCKRIAETERYTPTITCGPYSFVSYENQTVTLELNEYFKGDINGDKPTFKYVVQKAIPQETNVEWVINGQVDLAQGVVEGEKIEAAKTSDTTSYQSFLRSGFGYLAMMCDVGVTSDVNVRWALASLIDRNSVVEYVLGGYGGTVDAEYGIGQWMYQETAAELQEALKPISFNIDTANDYLDETEWVFEADGTTTFDRTKANSEGTYLRHNANGEVMEVNHLGISENVLTDIIEIQYAANAPLAGIKFNLSKSDYSSVLQEFYYGYELPDDERVYNTFNLASNFTAVFDRYYSWHSDFMDSQQNKGQLSDPELDELIIAMRETDPNDPDAYLDAWFDYQVRWNELMPQVPLYSNEYYDIHHSYVDGLYTTAFAGYEDIICQISKTVK